MRLAFYACLLMGGLLLGPRGADAALTIQITGGTEGAQPIAVVPFGWSGAQKLPTEVGKVVADDLRRSGRFAPLADKDLVADPHTGDQVNFQNWRVLRVDNLVVGKVQATGPDAYTVQFQLFDVFQGRQIIGYSIPARGEDLRRVAHHISDLIYHSLTGERGAFNTRIAYVTTDRKSKNDTDYELQVADSDGYNPQTILRSTQPIMSATWSPDGKQLAYVSFERHRSQIYIQNVASGARRVVASYPGIDGAPAFSPDGTRLAMTLSKDGSPDIYILDLSTGHLTRLTDDPSIDTEADWMPDGKSVVFTSDRGGGPQLYQISAAGGPAKRLTFDGNYNAGASVSPDGTHIAMVHGAGGSYQIAVLDLKTGLLQTVSKGPLDESPSFAPNGSMILYAAEHGNRGVLSTVSEDGRAGQRLVAQQGDVSEPAWSPFRAQ
ncbi:MAG: Tol-Pal system beta propeller repeat protein TolB [Gammaproteobacteria bacterium]